MNFGIDKKTEACEVLASTYAMLANKVGQDKDEAYDNYMSRCLGRDNEVVCEQVLREAFKRVTKDSGTSWVTEYAKEKTKREKAEQAYRELKEKVEKPSMGEKEISALFTYGRPLNCL